MSMEWDPKDILVLLLLAACILFLVQQLWRLCCPLHRRLRSKFLSDALTSPAAEVLLDGRRDRPALSDAAVRRAVPLRAAVLELQFGDIPSEDMRLRRFWWRAWIYVAAALVLAYTAPAFFSGSAASAEAALLLMTALCAYSLGLLLRSISDFRERLIVRWLAEQENALQRDASSGRKAGRG